MKIKIMNSKIDRKWKEEGKKITITLV